MGAAILIETLPDAAFCAAVADSAFADLAQLAVFRIGNALHVPRTLHSVVAAPVVSAAMWYARVRHGVALSAASPVQRLARSRVPVLVIHGTGDREIPASDARTLAAANPRVVTVWMVEGAGHTRAWATAPREYPARVAAFLAQHQ
jgi:pimeloyl-ACP methyl ester carboxylesterase